MPNHISTVCTVTGPDVDVATFRERHIRRRDDKDGSFFDFQTVIPKPAIVDQTESGSEADIGLAALVGDVVWTDFRRFTWLPPEVLTDAPYRHARQVRAWLAKNKPEALAKARLSLQCLVETGCPSWYEWSIENWGTKWGGYDYAEVTAPIDGRFVFRFQTAWSFPEPIFRKLAEMYPALTFAVISFDEGWNFACDGEFNGANNYRCSKDLATADMYERVYGHRPDDDDDDDDDDVDDVDDVEEGVA